MSPTSKLSRRLRAASLLAPAALALACGVASAKTLVFCSEGSPENFYAEVNTTGTSFDATTQIYNNLVEFERALTAAKCFGSILVPSYMSPAMKMISGRSCRSIDTMREINR